jgi:23S rRNA pseudouridine1911/1915/1917 synthase
MEFIIKPENGGINIKDFLRREINPSRKLLNLTKSKPDGILINGERMTVRYILQPGDILNFNYKDIDNACYKVSQNEDLLDLIEIIYEDDYILCVNKPPDMPSHPSFNHLDDTLANAVAAYYFRQNKNTKFHPVNRLDKNTSGLVLIAKDKLASAKLNAQIKRGEIKKVYQAIITGDFNELSGGLEYDFMNKTGSITAPIKREQDSIIKRICAPDGNYAVTEFKFIKTNGEISLAEVYPITGRTHQIRVHFQAIGAALLGDDLYYNNFDSAAALSEKYNIKRHALHAASLGFEHPMNKSNIKIECALPEDMQKIIEKL